MKQKSTETQLEPTKHQQLVSTRKELDWIKTRLSDTQSEEESTGKWRTEKDGEIKWLKKRLVETLAELDSSKNEVEGLRLNSAWSGSGSSVSSAGTPRYPTGGEGGGVDIRPPYPVSAMPVSPLGPGTPAPGAGGFVLPTAVSAIDVTWE